MPVILSDIIKFVKKVYLVRHGKRESHHEDTPLSEIGIKQAEITGKYLKAKNINKIYVSPLLRTQETAKIISEIINVPIKTDDRLKERFLWDENMESYEQFLDEWHKASGERDYRSKGRDSAKISGERLKSVVEDVLDAETSLVIAHSGIIGDFLTSSFPKDKLPFQIDQHDSSLFVEILECSITELQIDGSKTTLLRVNDVSHLSGSLV